MADQEELAHGHLFRFTVQSKGVGRVVGDPTWTEANWWGPPWALEVRAFSLVSALMKATDRTDEDLGAWDMNPEREKRLIELAEAPCEVYTVGRCSDSPERSASALFAYCGYCWPCRIKQALDG